MKKRIVKRAGAYPWGESIVHKGVDIFGDLNTKTIRPVNTIL
ncbi:MAG: hypothetical protein V4663_04880 [Bacteroidota bacterium]